MSTVIKASGPIHASEGSSFNFDDMGYRANQYLEGIRRQAAEILAQAHQQAITIREEAKEQGRAAALEAAENILDEKVGRQLTSLLPAVREAVDRIQQARAEWLTYWEQTAVHVAAAIAGRIVRRELQKAPEITLALVKEALDLASGGTAIQLHMHPDDVAAMGQQVERLAAEVSRLAKAEIVADPRITKGGCRVDTRFGVIDQQFEAQLARIEEELT